MRLLTAKYPKIQDDTSAIVDVLNPKQIELYNKINSIKEQISILVSNKH